MFSVSGIPDFTLICVYLKQVTWTPTSETINRYSFFTCWPLFKVNTRPKHRYGRYWQLESCFRTNVGSYKGTCFPNSVQYSCLQLLWNTHRPSLITRMTEGGTTLACIDIHIIPAICWHTPCRRVVDKHPMSITITVYCQRLNFDLFIQNHFGSKNTGNRL